MILLSMTLFRIGLNSAETYDPKTDTWTMIAEMSTRRSSVGVGVLNSVVYAVGGYDGSCRQCLNSYVKRIILNLLYSTHSHVHQMFYKCKPMFAFYFVWLIQRWAVQWRFKYMDKNCRYASSSKRSGGRCSWRHSFCDRRPWRAIGA